MKVLVMADSSGDQLRMEIQNMLHELHPQLEREIDITVRTMEGATLTNIIKKMESKYTDFPCYDIIYVHAGVNNLTRKCGCVVNPIYDNIPHLIDDITDKITNLKCQIKFKCKNVVFVRLVGIDMVRYSKQIDDGFWYYQQKVINESMPLLAHAINFVNKAD